MAYTARPEAWFWILGFFLLAWFTAGLFIVCYDAFFFDDQMLEKMTAAQLDLRETRPKWTLANTFIATILGVIGAVAMLLRKRMSVVFFALSLFSVILNTVYFYLVIDGFEVLATFDIVMSIIVILVGLLAWYAANRSRKRGWLVQTTRTAH